MHLLTLAAVGRRSADREMLVKALDRWFTAGDATSSQHYTHAAVDREIELIHEHCDA
jgi:hypothetical protein